jgi:hypothetical protein
MPERDRLRLLAMGIDHHHRVEIVRRLGNHGRAQRDQRLDGAVQLVAIEHPVDGVGEIVAAAAGMHPAGHRPDALDQRRFVGEIGPQRGVIRRTGIDGIQPAQDGGSVGACHDALFREHHDMGAVHPHLIRKGRIAERLGRGIEIVQFLELGRLRHRAAADARSVVQRRILLGAG